MAREHWATNKMLNISICNLKKILIQFITIFIKNYQQLGSIRNQSHIITTMSLQRYKT